MNKYLIVILSVLALMGLASLAWARAHPLLSTTMGALMGPIAGLAWSKK